MCVYIAVHIQSSCFDKDWQWGSVTGSLRSECRLGRENTNDKRWQHLILTMRGSWDWPQMLTHTHTVTWQPHKYIHVGLWHAKIFNLPPGPLANNRQSGDRMHYQKYMRKYAVHIRCPPQIGFSAFVKNWLHMSKSRMEDGISVRKQKRKGRRTGTRKASFRRNKQWAKESENNFSSSWG